MIIIVKNTTQIEQRFSRRPVKDLKFCLGFFITGKMRGLQRVFISSLTIL